MGLTVEILRDVVICNVPRKTSGPRLVIAEVVVKDLAECSLQAGVANLALSLFLHATSGQPRLFTSREHVIISQTAKTGKQLNFNSCPLRGPRGFSPESTCQAPFPFPPLFFFQQPLARTVGCIAAVLELFVSLMSLERAWSHFSVILKRLKTL